MPASGCVYEMVALTPPLNTERDGEETYAKRQKSEDSPTPSDNKQALESLSRAREAEQEAGRAVSAASLVVDAARVVADKAAAARLVAAARLAAASDKVAYS